MLNSFPKFFTSKAITYYLLALVAVSVVFFNRMLPFSWWLFGLLFVIGFFYFSNKLTNQWTDYSEVFFVKKLFQVSLLIRLIWVLFSYFFYLSNTGTTFNFDAGDAIVYHETGLWIARLLKGFDLTAYYDSMGGNYSDMGYSIFLGAQYLVTDGSMFIARVIKALFSAWTVVLIYKLGARNFGENTGRIAGILAMLMPLMIFYTGLHLKEVEMVFLAMLFLERADKILRSKKVNFLNIIILTIVVSLLFLFRTVLGAAALFSIFTALLFSSGKVTKLWKRVFVSVWVILAIAFFLGGNIASEIESVWEGRHENQEQSLEWRSKREGGNSFAKYASSAVFAPAIFIIPFPTMVNVETQRNQMMFHGGYYVKNVLAFFVMYAFLIIIIQKKWRENLLISSFLLGYLLIIAFSAFAQSERFHQPVLPVFLIFVAYGITQIEEKHKKYFNYYLIFLFVAIVTWSWFKLAGRGLA